MNLLHISQNFLPASCEDMMQQFQFFNKISLEKTLSEYTNLKERENFSVYQQVQTRSVLTEKIKPWFCPLRSKSRFSNKKQEKFPKEIFIHNFQKMKSIFGHKSMEEEFDEYVCLASPVYNLLYDKTGKVIITADDDGFFMKKY